MTRPDPANVRRVACVGAGTNGGGWAAQFLHRGYDVAAWDPAPDGAERLRR
jgi:carnitine 3-dehydrogenase